MAQAAAQSPSAPDDSFPLQPAAVVREMVTVSHFSLKRVKELVGERPALAKAAVDWGFGDWEDALGAASHVGNRDIAEYLLAQGARPTIFSAAMLGQLEVVKAFVAAQPGVQRTPGPHSISLLAHAKAGGRQAVPVYDYLTSLGDAGSPLLPKLSLENAKSCAGTYRWGPETGDEIEIIEKDGQLSFARKGRIARGLVYLGERAFYPLGASAVRINFSGEGEGILLTVHDAGVLVTARRIPR